mmetsp:Transcript_14661/g.35777  ORF Transcript_14661/g.35777 Transcript_14661/m.35777 type:complete len:84 (+) Transcript_14661:1217-1468(+)
MKYRIEYPFTTTQRSFTLVKLASTSGLALHIYVAVETVQICSKQNLEYPAGRMSRDDAVIHQRLAHLFNFARQVLVITKFYQT